MNRRAFFSALAGAPVAVVAGSSAQASQSWPIQKNIVQDERHKYRRYQTPYIDQEFKCECGSPLFHSTGVSTFISKVNGLETYSVRQVCSWCGKMRGLEA